MSKETSNPLIDLSELSKPVDTLFKKIAKGVGGLAAPWQIERVAEAKIEAAHSAAEVARIEAHSEIEVAGLRQRAAQRRIEEDTRHQRNMEDITAKAIPHLNEDAKPDAMEDDWIANFFDKCRIISDGEMQSLWARVLAGEANAPDTYSKRTVNFISELDKSDAELFTKFCGFVWLIENFTSLVFNLEAEIYNKHGVNSSTLGYLEDIGLVQYEHLSGFAQLGLPKRFTVHYYNKPLLLKIPENTRNALNVGKVRLTKIGRELVPICGSKPVDGFYEYVRDQWREFLPEVENTEPQE